MTARYQLCISRRDSRIISSCQNALPAELLQYSIKELNDLIRSLSRANDEEYNVWRIAK